MCHQQPGHVYAPLVAKSAIFGVRSIIGGYGVVNQNNKYVGTVCFAIRVADLNDRIQQHLHSSKLSYVLLDESLKPVCTSLSLLDTLNFSESTFFQEELSNEKIRSHYEGELEKCLEIREKEVTFQFYHKIEGYPYYALVGIDKSAKRQFFFNKFLPLLSTVFASLLSGMVFSFVIRKHFLKQAFYSTKLQENLRKQLNTRRKQFFDQYDHNLFKLSECSKKHIKRLDPNELIKDSINTFWLDLKGRRLKIKLNLSDVEPLLLDPLLFQLVIINILWLAITSEPKNNKILISSRVADFEGKSFLIIEWQFKGALNLRIEDFKYYDDNFSKGCDLADLKMTFDQLTKNILDLGGTPLFVNHGESLILRFPYPETINFTSKMQDKPSKNDLRKKVPIIPFHTSNEKH